MKRWILILVPLVLLGWLIGWRVNQKTAEVAAQNKMRAVRMKAPPVVAVAAAQVRDIVPTFESVGSVESPFNVKIAAKVTGRVEFLQVRQGDPVTQGQVLVRTDPSEIQAMVLQQQAALAQAHHRLSQALLTQNPANVQVSTQIKQQEAALGSAEADYDQVSNSNQAQIAAAEAVVTDAKGRVNSAEAAIGNALAGIRSAQANFKDAKAKCTRTDDLFKQGFLAAQDADDARAAVDVQQGAVDVASGQLNAAKAARDSAVAQQQSAEKQLDVVKMKGKSDIADALAKVQQARASLEYAKANKAQGPAYEQNLYALKADVAAAEAGLQNGRAQLANTVLRSPINGFVTERDMDPGAIATAGTPILAVQSIRQVWVTVPVPEEVSRSIYVGQPATVRLDALPGRTFTGKVIHVNAAADPMSRQFMVQIAVDNRQDQIKPGMFAAVTMVTQRIRATVVPREAVAQSPTGASVIVVSQTNVAQRRPVTLGASDADGIAIKSGIQPGERVVVLSAMPVRDGQVVRTGGGRPHGGKRGGAAGSAGARGPHGPQSAAADLSERPKT
jgi:HlyD family secretion protein